MVTFFTSLFPFWSTMSGLVSILFSVLQIAKYKKCFLVVWSFDFKVTLVQFHLIHFSSKNTFRNIWNCLDSLVENIIIQNELMINTGHGFQNDICGSIWRYTCTRLVFKSRNTPLKAHSFSCCNKHIYWFVKY